MLISRPHVGPSATAFARTALPPEVALERMAEYPLPAMFTKGLIFPAVTHVEGQEGRWDRVGASRLIHLGDGGTVTETLVERVPGSSFAYELTRFTDVFRHLVVGVRGEWSVAPDGDGSLIRWTWEFAPLPFRRALMTHVVAHLWRHYAQAILEPAVRDASREPVAR
ncbi:SRPBCC family protein [uncultured Amnibacterium sp.]|uniref:SRPBCC family protein n=1 Tax=uncultured Amnibacterium sp. TaxID=1631851 RepID=UPI0035CBF54D